MPGKCSGDRQDTLLSAAAVLKSEVIVCPRGTLERNDFLCGTEKEGEMEGYREDGIIGSCHPQSSSRTEGLYCAGT